MKILKLTNSGLPVSWITPDIAAGLVLKGMVNWSLGKTRILKGGLKPCGDRSFLELPSIIAVNGTRATRVNNPPLTNAMLFKRDGYRCMYCGEDFTPKALTRDHIQPRGQGGQDRWMDECCRCMPTL